MTLTASIRNRINRIPDGKLFGYSDLGVAKKDYMATAKAIERLKKEGLIKVALKGVYYKPELTVFGELKPDYSEILRAYLFQNGKRIAYETGTSLYNRMGLTTQMAFRIKIASRGKRININFGSLQAVSAKSYVEVTDSNYEILGVLDAIKDIKRIPDCSLSQGILRLGTLLNSTKGKQADLIIRCALQYPPRVRALLGALLEKNGVEQKRLEQLRDSLNPLSTFKLGIKETDLPSKSKWYIQ